MLENPGLKVSPYALFVYSSYCINFRGDMNTAVDLTRLAYNLLQDSNDPHRAIALLNTSTYLGFRMHPYKEVLASMNKVYQMATEDGAFASVGYACIHEVYIMVMGGENVSQAIVKAEKWKLLMLAKRNFFIVFGINISMAILKLLRGDTLHNDTLTFEGFSQEDTERGLAHMPPVAVFSYLVYKMFAKVSAILFYSSHTNAMCSACSIDGKKLTKFKSALFPSVRTQSRVSCFTRSGFSWRRSFLSNCTRRTSLLRQSATSIRLCSMTTPKCVAVSFSSLSTNSF